MVSVVADQPRGTISFGDPEFASFGASPDGGWSKISSDFKSCPEDNYDRCAEEARRLIQQCLKKAEYEALKTLQCGFIRAAQILAVSGGGVQQHAIYVSREEVFYRDEVQGDIRTCSRFEFQLRFPCWRVVRYPEDDVHAETIIKRAKEFHKLEKANEDSRIRGASEAFVLECITGTARSWTDGIAEGSAPVLGSIASSMMGGGAAVPFATSTVPVYYFGFIPWGTTTVVSSSVIAAGGVFGAALGLGAAITLSYMKRSQVEASLKRLPFSILNDTGGTFFVKVFYATDQLCCFSLCEGEILPSKVPRPLELDPPREEEDFHIIISDGRSQLFAQTLCCATVRRGGVYVLRRPESHCDVAAAGAGADGTELMTPSSTSTEIARTSERAPALVLERVSRSFLPAYW
mmetsp:Transcript_75924/g.158340  ORF Transcript_75924/g.158340 Transcript_75924/m.158340 type:complete len:405 (-) Transcript_75924:434-1648(-)|eukprot:CAMPEP_0206493700 /NCGR_PEP_ID=MMETSP0324_2-20121206/47183_1 /ASSEMBLY_ACC=CAM_ASM_000836 /TAXON_ID=2866 /ORGANISM="Crypthecodinium cohnii, Strain Seligo" /LENGTH=404 /DNA_ID=CAMNT_0053977003 /DNA_START=75 /DNA_END=1286 /DNA_ORIENTATION=-